MEFACTQTQEKERLTLALREGQVCAGRPAVLVQRVLCWWFMAEGAGALNLGWILLRSGIAVAVLTLLTLGYLSQRYWYRALWRMTANWGRVWLRVGLRVSYLAILALMVLTFSDAVRQDHGMVLPNRSPITAFMSLWLASALVGYVLIQGVHGLEWVWHRVRKPEAAEQPAPSSLRARMQDFVPD